MAALKIIGKVAVKVMPDTSDFKDRLRKDLEKIERDLSPRKIKVVPDWDKTAAKNVKRQFDAMRRSMSGRNVTVDPKLGSTANISAGLALLTRDRTVSIEPNLDQRAVAQVLAGLLAMSGGRVHIDQLREGLERLMELDRLTPMIAGMALKTTMLGAAALSATAHTLALAAGLGQILGAGLALPGILGGIVIGLGVTAAAFVQIGDYVPELAKRLSSLQDSLGAAFWEQAAGPMRDMIDNLWPAISAGVNGAASALGNFFGTLFTDLSGLNLKPMFDALIESVKVFTDYTDNIASIIEKLGQTGSAYLPRLADWFGGLIAQFDTWLGTGAKMNAWIETGIANLLALFDIIGSVASIFGGLSRAAVDAGGIGLSALADGLARIADVVNSKGFQSGLTDVFRAANDAMSNLLTGAAPGLEAMILNIRDLFVEIAPQVGAALGNLIDGLGRALGSPLVADGITKMFDGILNALETLSGATGPVVMILATLAPIVGALAENIALVLTNGLERMAPAFQMVADAVLPLIDTLGSLANDVLNQLQPLWETMASNLTNIITALDPLIQKFQELWNLIAPVLIPVLQFLAQMIGDTIVMAINGLTDIVSGLIKVFQGIVDFVMGVFTGDWSRAWQGIQDIFSGVIQGIWGLVQTYFALGVLKLVKAGWSAIRSVFSESGTLLKEAAEAVWESIRARASSLWGSIKAIPGDAMGAIKGFITGAKDDIVTGAQLIWEGIKKKATTELDEVKKMFKDLPGNITGFLTGASTLLTGIGKDIVQGLIDGVDAMWDKVKDKFSALTDLIPDWKGPRERDKVLLTPAGKYIMQGLIKGLESQFSSVRDSLSRLTNDIASSLTGSSDYSVNVGTNLDTSGMSAVSGLSAQIGAAVAAPSLDTGSSIQIDNITIPLEDLQQLKSLEDFMNMLRVRTRQGVVAHA